MAQNPAKNTSLLLQEQDHKTLLKVAGLSIDHGLIHEKPYAPNPGDFSAALQQHRAVFVTLHKHGALRGCVGHLEATQSLVEDTAENAFAAAFRDPRFPPLTRLERDELDVQISILTPPEPLAAESEADVLDQLRPGVDGLILTTPEHRATFLPVVWETLPDPQHFLEQLKKKAGLPRNAWPKEMQFFRYQCESVKQDVMEENT